MMSPGSASPPVSVRCCSSEKIVAVMLSYQRSGSRTVRMTLASGCAAVSSRQKYAPGQSTIARKPASSGRQSIGSPASCVAGRRPRARTAPDARSSRACGRTVRTRGLPAPAQRRRAGAPEPCPNDRDGRRGNARRRLSIRHAASSPSSTMGIPPSQRRRKCRMNAGLWLDHGGMQLVPRTRCSGLRRAWSLFP